MNNKNGKIAACIQRKIELAGSMRMGPTAFFILFLSGSLPGRNLLSILILLLKDGLRFGFTARV